MSMLKRRLTKAGYGEYIDRIEALILAGELQQVGELLLTLGAVGVGDAPFWGVEIPPSSLENRQYTGLDLRGLTVQGDPARSLKAVAFTNCDLSGASFQGHYDEEKDRYWNMRVNAQFDSCDLTGFEFEGVWVGAIHLHNCYVRDARKPVELVSCRFKGKGRDTLKVTGKALPLKLLDITSWEEVPLILTTYELFESQVRMITTDRDVGVYPVNR